jgi:hypothetical protein
MSGGRGIFVVATIAATALAAGSLGWAAIPGAGGVIDACYEKRTGILRVIDTEAGKGCLSFENGLAWNQRGDPGPAGPKGDPGQPGDPLASLDALHGIPCTHQAEPGSVELEYSADGTAVLRCEPVPSPLCAPDPSSELVPVDGDAGGMTPLVYRASLCPLGDVDRYTFRLADTLLGERPDRTVVAEVSFFPEETGFYLLCVMAENCANGGGPLEVLVSVTDLERRNDSVDVPVRIESLFGPASRYELLVAGNVVVETG